MKSVKAISHQLEANTPAKPRDPIGFATRSAKPAILIHAMFDPAEWLRQQRRKYPERHREYSRNYYHRHKNDPNWRKHRTEYPRRYFLQHLHYHTTYAREWQRRLKAEVIEHYGKACACCGETTYEFLCIDHINGGGNKHREELGCTRNFYSWLKKNGYPEGFRTLCHNCNQSLGYNGFCPHQQKK
jgi:hypothetical protein